MWAPKQTYHNSLLIANYMIKRYSEKIGEIKFHYIIFAISPVDFIV